MKRRSLALLGTGGLLAAAGMTPMGSKVLSKLHSKVDAKVQDATVKLVPPTPMGVGGNVSVWDWTPSPYVNMVNAARGFGRVGAWEEDFTLKRDANGWPLEPSQIVLAGMHTHTTPGMAEGVWKGRYRGSANMEVALNIGSSLENVKRQGDVVTFDCVIKGPASFGLRFDGPITDLRVVAPGYDIDKHPLLIPQAVDYYKRFHTLRMLDFMGLNDTEDKAEITWSQRQASGKFHGRRSWEAMVDFFMACYTAPQSKVKGIWVCIPFRFGDADTLALARFLKSKLPSEVLKYVEFSNELWNSSYSVKWEHILGRANDPKDVDYAKINTPAAESQWQRLGRLQAWLQARHAKATLEGFGQETFGKTVFPVMCGQAANIGWQKDQGLPWLSLPEQIKALGGPPSSYIAALGIAPYLSGDDAEMDKTSSADEMLKLLRSGYANSLEATKKRLVAWRKLQSAYGIQQLVGYEWQLHTHGNNNRAVKFDANHHAAAEQLILDQALAMRDAGMGLMCYLSISPGSTSRDIPNSWLWPLTQNWDLSSTPKGRGVLKALAASGV
jgi:hypothetical protein